MSSFKGGYEIIHVSEKILEDNLIFILISTYLSNNIHNKLVICIYLVIKLIYSSLVFHYYITNHQYSILLICYNSFTKLSLH